MPLDNEADPNGEDGPGVDPRFQDVPVVLTVSIGRARASVRELVDLDKNAVLALDRTVDDPVSIYVGERLVAYGELQLTGEETQSLCVRVTEICSDDGP